MITIREEQSQDIEIIREVNLKAFSQSQEAKLVDMLRQSCNEILSLVGASRLDPGRVASTLLQLELKGWVQQSAGKRFALRCG